MAELHAVQPARTDADIAKEIRMLLEKPLADLCSVLNAARAEGLTVNLMIAPDAYGRQVPTVTIVKPL